MKQIQSNIAGILGISVALPCLIYFSGPSIIPPEQSIKTLMLIVGEFLGFVVIGMTLINLGRIKKWKRFNLGIIALSLSSVLLLVVYVVLKSQWVYSFSLEEYTIIEPLWYSEELLLKTKQYGSFDEFLARTDEFTVHELINIHDTIGISVTKIMLVGLFAIGYTSLVASMMIVVARMRVQTE